MNAGKRKMKKWMMVHDIDAIRYISEVLENQGRD